MILNQLGIYGWKEPDENVVMASLLTGDPLLLKGNIRTTYGTDFDCIAQHILEHGFDKAVIITDGYASMKPESQEQLKEHRLQTLTVLSGGKTDCPEFAHFGDVVQLEEVTS